MNRFTFPALALVVLLLSPGSSFAEEQKTKGPQQAASQAKASQKSATQGKVGNASQPKAVAPTKLVDINSATRQELKSLPGIRDAEAAKIVAGRPYLTKAQLVTRNILERKVYEDLKKLIIAKQV